MQKNIRKYFPLFVLPVLAAFVVGFVIPFILGLYLSFCRFTTVTDAVWVGWENYARLAGDTAFGHAFWYTALFAAVTVVLINVLAFLAALGLTRGLRGTTFFRTVFFLPNLIGGIVLGYIWQLIFNGVLARWGTALALNEWYGFWGLVILVSWQQIGYMMIIYIAGLQAVPPELLEAARIDGAGGRQILFRITIPTVMPSVAICTFLTLTNAFKLFDQNLSLTAGEPGTRSELLALNIYNTFYSRVGWEGVGQAKAVIFSLLVSALALLSMTLTRQKGERNK